MPGPEGVESPKLYVVDEKLLEAAITLLRSTTATAPPQPVGVIADVAMALAQLHPVGATPEAVPAEAGADAV